MHDKYDYDLSIFYYTDEFVINLLILIQSVLLLCPTTVEGKKKIDFHFRPSDCQIFDLECVSNWKAGIGCRNRLHYIPK